MLDVNVRNGVLEPHIITLHHKGILVLNLFRDIGETIVSSLPSKMYPVKQM